MTPPDYEYLRKILKERSGLDLSADKQYLVESRLVPLARKAGIASLGIRKGDRVGVLVRCRAFLACASQLCITRAASPVHAK